MPVSPETQRAVELTIRTAPVVTLTQALTVVDTGAAMATVPTRTKDTNAVRVLREDMSDLLEEFWGDSQLLCKMY
jgi:hypothetical protein